jgi:(p)ppGpp synthase/HD superfamily hydrolase
MDYKTLKIAYNIAKKAHINQKRWNGDPYITHPERVAKCFGNEKLKIIAILHDVIEDTNLSALDLVYAGIPKNIVNTILILTKKEGEDYLTYIQRISKSTDAIAVKQCDLADNLRDLKKGSMKDKYQLAYYILSEINAS